MTPIAGTGLGSPHLHLRTVDSTNSRARDLAAAGAPHGTLVTATEQSAGRGRQGRSWVAPAGQALLLSLVLRRWTRLLPLAAGVAVAEEAGAGAMVKWPNDVLVQGRKVAGILVEGRPQAGWMVLGIGLNVAVSPEDFPPELRDTATGLGRTAAEVEPTLVGLLGRLGHWLGPADDQVLEALRTRDALAGREVRWGEGEGRAEGIDADGSLLVRTAAGEQQALRAGEVHLRPYGPAR